MFCSCASEQQFHDPPVNQQDNPVRILESSMNLDRSAITDLTMQQEKAFLKNSTKTNFSAQSQEKNREQNSEQKCESNESIFLRLWQKIREGICGNKIKQEFPRIEDNGHSNHSQSSQNTAAPFSLDGIPEGELQNIDVFTVLGDEYIRKLCAQTTEFKP